MLGLVNFAKEPGSVELREIPVPQIGEEDVLLRVVQTVGICGSDLHQYYGKHSWRVNYPVVLGHEFAGRGCRNKGPPRFWIRRGRPRCERDGGGAPERFAADSRPLQPRRPGRLGFGYGVDGAMASFVKAPARCLHHVPSVLAPEIAALTEPCCVAYNAVCVNSRVRPGDSVAVIEPGPIGLLFAQPWQSWRAQGHLLVIGTEAVDAEKRLSSRRSDGRRYRPQCAW